MKFYLSSYKIGNETEKLKELIPENNKCGYIPNALDFTKADPERRKKHMDSDRQALNEVGFKVEVLDLKEYFGRPNELQKKMSELGAVWVSGGNTFVLRQAMKISGFDEILKGLVERQDFLYAGYSAGCCILAPSLKCLQIVDDPNDMPYKQIKETIWKGLGLIDYVILPHYASEHSESKDIDKEVQYCIDNKILFKALKDGEVIIIE